MAAKPGRMTANMKDIILQCACCRKEITDLSAAGWRNGERRSFECPECGCRTKVEAEVWLRLSSDAEETWRELYRLAQWGACETWFDSDGALRVYGADDLGGRELAALWIAPEHGYEEAAGLHVTVDGGPVPVSVYAGMEPEAAAKAIWERIEAIRRKEPGQ